MQLMQHGHLEQYGPGTAQIRDQEAYCLVNADELADTRRIG